MTTTADIILQSLKASGVVGVGQSAQAEDLSDSLFQVNLILGQWSRKRWLNTDLIDVAFTTTGAQSYSIGVGGDINTPRPDKIESAFFRVNGGLLYNAVLDGAGGLMLDDAGNVITDGTVNPRLNPQAFDYELGIIEAREEYNLIPNKGIVAWPRAMFYDSSYPMGRIYLWPVPVANAFQVHLSMKVGILPITNPALDLLFPPEYADALMWTLCARLRPMYGLTPEPTITAAMRAALNTIRVANTQISVLRLDPILGGRRMNRVGGFWNGYGGIVMVAPATAPVVPSIVPGSPALSQAQLNLAALLQTVQALPTSLPASAGNIWLNNGVLCVS